MLLKLLNLVDGEHLRNLNQHNLLYLLLLKLNLQYKIIYFLFITYYCFISLSVVKIESPATESSSPALPLGDMVTLDCGD